MIVSNNTVFGGQVGVEVAPEPRLISLMVKFKNENSNYRTLLLELNQILIRIRGSVPEPKSEDSSPLPMSFMADLEIECNMLTVCNASLNNFILELKSII